MQFKPVHHEAGWAGELIWDQSKEEHVTSQMLIVCKRGKGFQ